MKIFGCKKLIFFIFGEKCLTPTITKLKIFEYDFIVFQEHEDIKEFIRNNVPDKN